MADPQIITIPCLQDNYAFLLHDPSTGATACIDVPDAAPIQAALGAQGWTLTDILLTHHHWDHIDGVPALVEATGAKVWGAAADAHRLPPLDHALAEGDTIRIGALEGDVMDVSGHTVGHVAFHFPAATAVFTADSLMALGCGRLFEGTPAQMHGSLEKLKMLPPGTLVCSGHEYTASNARFALTIEPDNPDLIFRVERITAARAAGQPTVPSTLAEELATNPFLRADAPTVAAPLDMEGADPVDVFTRIRAQKDSF
ncbi:hydroxyacylglutathione hydrolase [Jannaschia sp. CCS1]|uniref:Hydroxyacylglutathione hydrolase n=1 Tax=Jannaschia sp. (strain CCS1) TaxID=290400 RepID=GLO2_JANSC|nr:hydroxyacylglutathione hydrolase [Jannaschia sp. CCS1]Q28TK3.1 RecName: Full=Hydroxyacylglutathione hydrolase; AltName: Full=Glyoxalase II; Short=Glx II [Jannaschia sp. CCS1]ABD53959.1 Hydroxyacylglutathione hydrolase [Jannaschia sp. CCS1]